MENVDAFAKIVRPENIGKRIQVAASLTLVSRLYSKDRAGQSPNDYGPKLHRSDETAWVRLGGRANNVFGNLFPLLRAPQNMRERLARFSFAIEEDTFRDRKRRRVVFSRIDVATIGRYYRSLSIESRITQLVELYSVPDAREFENDWVEARTRRENDRLRARARAVLLFGITSEDNSGDAISFTTGRAHF